MNIEGMIQRIFLVSTDNTFIQFIQSNSPNYFSFHIFSSLSDCISNIYYRPSAIFIDEKVKTNTFEKSVQNINSFDSNILLIHCCNQNELVGNDFLEKYFYDHFCCSNLQAFQLRNLLHRIERLTKSQFQIDELKANIHHDLSKYIVCNSSLMQRTALLIEKASKTNITAYINGEVGSGKGLAAYIIHQLSDRQSFPYQSINLSSIAEDEVEEQLFGKENNNKVIGKGKFELAAEGSLYLENISSISNSLQAKLLKVLQTNSFTRVGGTEKIQFNARLIVSAQHNLLAKMTSGSFREDLYYRLMGLPILVPPLRERGNDILLLANKFLENFSTKNNLPKKEISKKAKKKILAYSFPGNVRELKTTIERAFVMCDNNTITDEDIEFHSDALVPNFLTKEMSFEEYKSTIIHHFLKKYDNDIILVSNKLDIGKSTIYRMLKSEKEKEKKRFSWFNFF